MYAIRSYYGQPAALPGRAGRLLPELPGARPALALLEEAPWWGAPDLAASLPPAVVEDFAALEYRDITHLMGVFAGSGNFCDNTIAVANARNFTRAAEQLRIAQPAVSMSIARLEEELDLPLFNRNGRQIALT